MPSTDDDDRFVPIDWTGEECGRTRPDARTVGLGLALAALAVSFAYDFVFSPDELFWVFGGDLSRIDWLFLVSTVLFVRYGVIPLATKRERIVRHLSMLRARPAGAVAFTVLLLMGVIGTLGPEALYDVGYPRLEYRLQPPVFTKVFVGEQYYYNCAGEAAGEYCHGSWRYPLGTTQYGEDVVVLLVQGMRVGLKIGFVTAMIMAVVATAVGTVAGYFGGWIDELLMRYVDVQQVVPAIVVYIVLATMFFGNHDGVSDGGAFVFVLVFGFLDWGGIARLVRSDVLKRRSAGYVRAARAAGASDLHIIRRHIVPNSSATIVTALTRRVPLVILAQIALAYLSLNRIGSKSLGRLFRIGLGGFDMPWHQKWWVTTFAAVLLALLVLSFNIFGDAVRDVLDPREAVE